MLSGSSSVAAAFAVPVIAAFAIAVVGVDAVLRALAFPTGLVFPGVYFALVVPVGVPVFLFFLRRGETIVHALATTAAARAVFFVVGSLELG